MRELDALSLSGDDGEDIPRPLWWRDERNARARAFARPSLQAKMERRIRQSQRGEDEFLSLTGY
jgi:hypothetical protein